jgi:hypothetical protein
MHGHFDQCYGGDAYRLEVLGVFGPGPGGAQGLVCFFIVSIECVPLRIDEADGVFEL